MADEQRKRGRPKTGCVIRNTRISGYVTAQDADYIKKVAADMGFTSTSEMITAILERLCIGGFSPMVFAKLGWQFGTLMAKQKVQGGFYFGVRPLPPLFSEEPSEADIAGHLETVKKEVEENGFRSIPGLLPAGP